MLNAFIKQEYKYYSFTAYVHERTQDLRDNYNVINYKYANVHERIQDANMYTRLALY